MSFTLQIPTLVLQIPTEVVQLCAATAMGLCLGIERAISRKPASLTTFSLVSLSSCLFTLLSVDASQGTFDTTRIAAQIVSGIGFVGAGVIFKDHSNIEGITTAVMIWMSAAIGMACGFNKITYVAWSLALYFTAIFICHRIHSLLRRFSNGQEEQEE